MRAGGTKGLQLRLSLRLKVALAMVGVTAAVGLFLTVQTRSVLTQFAEESLRLRTDEVAYALSASALSALLASDLASLEEVVTQLSRRPDVRFIAVANESGGIVAASDPTWLGRPLEELHPAEDAEFRRLPLVVPGASEPVGHAHVELGRAALLSALEKLSGRTLLLGVAGLLLATVIGGFLSSRLTRTLDGVVGSARQIVEGDLTVAAPRAGNDEVGDLSASFEAMREAVVGMVTRSREGVGAISAAVSAATSLAAANRQVSNQVSTSTQHAVTAIQQLSTMAERTLERAEQMLELSETSERAASEGLRSADSSISEMQRLLGEISSIASLTQGLADRMQQVEKVNATVSEIARQAHLVSVNARLEAARAGEAGRTFSAVAGQMRALADNSHEGGRQIHVMLSEIQDAFAGVLQTVVNAQRRAGEAGRIAEQSRRALDRMVGALREFATSAQAIAVATREQQSGSGELVRTSRVIESAVELLVRSVSEQTATIGRMSGFSDELSTLVGRYRLPAVENPAIEPGGDAA